MVGLKSVGPISDVSSGMDSSCLVRVSSFGFVFPGLSKMLPLSSILYAFLLVNPRIGELLISFFNILIASYTLMTYDFVVLVALVILL